MHDSIQNRMKESLRRRRKKIALNTLCSLLVVVMIVGIFYTVRSPAVTEEYKDCHPAHDAACGYLTQVNEENCTHVCSPNSCTLLPGSETPCAHACGEDLGCTLQAIHCIHAEHDADCGYVQEEGVVITDCAHICGDACVSPGFCAHEEHDVLCGYSQAEEQYACAHAHDENCGAIEVVAECSHSCAVCDLSLGGTVKRTEGDIDQAVLAWITASQQSYKAGELIQFVLTTSYAMPNATQEDLEAASTAKVNIPLPADTGFEMVLNLSASTDTVNYLAGNGWYEVTTFTGSEMKLYYNENTRVFSFMLEPGQTGVQTTLNFRYPNGITENGTTLTLTPEIENQDQITGNCSIQGGSTKIQAAFGWNPVEKTVAEQNLGSDKDLADVLHYTITANKTATDVSQGVIYTGEYSVSDTLTFNGIGLHVGENTLTSWQDGANVVYGYTGVPLLIFYDVNLADIQLQFTPQINDQGDLTGLNFVYTVKNEPDAQSGKHVHDLDNLKLKLDLKLPDALVVFADLQADEGGILPHYIKNEVDFEAKSLFFDEGIPAHAQPEHYAFSEDDVTIKPILAGVSSLTKDAHRMVSGTSWSALSGKGEHITSAALPIVTDSLKSDEYVYFRVRFKNGNQPLANVTILDILPLDGDLGVGLFNEATMETLGVYMYDAGGTLLGANLNEWLESGVGGNGTVSTNSDAYPGTDLGQRYGGRRAYAGAMSFPSVPAGAEIVLVMRVKTISAIGDAAETTNYAFALKAMNENFTYSAADLIAADKEPLNYVPDAFTVEIEKTFVDANGNPAPMTGTKYIYSPGSTVYFEIGARNTSQVNPVTFTLKEYWPFAHLDAASVKGVPAGHTVRVYNAQGSFLGESAVSTGTDQSIDLSFVGSLTNPAYFAVENITLPGGGNVELGISGVVRAGGNDSAIVNKASAEGGGDSVSSQVSFYTKVLNLTMGKTPYLYEPVGEGGQELTSSLKSQNNFYLGDIIRYEFKIVNNSTTNDTLQNFWFYDNFFSTPFTVDSLRVGTLTKGGQSATGKIIVEYPNGTLIALEEVPYSTFSSYNNSDMAQAHLKYAIENTSSARKLHAYVVGANIIKGQALKFHIFFEITEAVETDYVANYKSSGARNTAYARGRDVDLVGETNYATADSNNTIYIRDNDSKRKVSVTKVPYAVLRGFDPDANNCGEYDEIVYPGADEILRAAEGDYIIYNITFTNKSETKLDIYPREFYDQLPEGTEFVGLTTSQMVEDSRKDGANYFGWYEPSLTGDPPMNPIALKRNYALIPDGTGYFSVFVTNKGWQNQTMTYYSNLSVPRVAYNQGTRTLTVNSSTKGGVVRHYPITGATNPGGLGDILFIAAGESASFAVVVRVTENRDSYENIGGFKFEGEIAVDGSGFIIEEDGTYTTIVDTATVYGPAYDVGISKAATHFSPADNTWSPIADTSIIEPKNKIRWEIQAENGIGSTGAIKEYTITDVLPKEFAYIAGSAKLNGTAIELSAETVSDQIVNGETVTTISWKITPQMTQAAIARGETISITFETQWKSGVAESYGLYQNDVSISLPDSYQIKEVLDGSYQNGTQRIDNSAQVNMLGMYGSTSYKTIENVTATDVYQDGRRAGLGTSPVVRAIVGDTIEYSLNVKNQSSLGAMRGLVIIDTLPQVGDSGVVNRVAKRSSAFNLLFPADPQVSVEIRRSGGNTDLLTPGNDYSVLYGDVGTALNEHDWAGFTPDATALTAWTAGNTAGMDSIRIAIAPEVEIETGDEVVVTFRAYVAGQASAFNSDGNVAWNSFGYRYQTRTGPWAGNVYQETLSNPLYAEPIKVGVKIPLATINVGKIVLDESDTPVSADSEEFSFILERRASSDEEWELAQGVYYIKDGVPTIIGADGRFTLTHGEDVTIYADTGLYYRVVEVTPEEPYELYKINDELVEAMEEDPAFVTGKLREEDRESAVFYNKQRTIQWDIVLIKRSYTEDLLPNIGFRLEVLEIDPVTQAESWTVVHENVATDAQGVIRFSGLPRGVYRITELASGEHNARFALTEPILVSLPYSADDEINSAEKPMGVTVGPSEADGNIIEVEVTNYLRYALPETGGSGAIKALVPSILLLISGGLLLINRRKRHKRGSHSI